jgi:hypothetical protein
MPDRLWCLLHRTFDIIAHTGYAQWQTGGSALRAVD